MGVDAVVSLRATMLQLSHGKPPANSRAGAGLILMQHKPCASFTSDLFFFSPHYSSTQPAHEEAGAVSRTVNERVCDEGRGVLLIHQCAASP